jgi:nucleoside-diphosphate-sugar epimerase
MLLALTGATGFIGQHLLQELPKRGHRVRVLLRRPLAVPIEAASAVIGDLARPRNMAAALEGVDAVIHSAGLAHAMSGVPEDDYRVINTEATIGIARAARRAGARRFIFLSSIRAQCGPAADTVMTEAVEASPTDAYGKSKLAAERGLAELDIDSPARPCHCPSAVFERAAPSWQWKIWRRRLKPSSPRRERCAALSSPPIRRR